MLRRYVPENIVGGIMGMRALASMMGAAFDIPDKEA
jgi:hypothetical protein